MQIPRSCPRFTESESKTLGVGPAVWVLNKPSKGSCCTVMFENHCYHPTTHSMGEKPEGRVMACPQCLLQDLKGKIQAPPILMATPESRSPPKLRPFLQTQLSCVIPPPTFSYRPKCSPSSGYFSIGFATHLCSRTAVTNWWSTDHGGL